MTTILFLSFLGIGAAALLGGFIGDGGSDSDSYDTDEDGSDGQEHGHSLGGIPSSGESGDEDDGDGDGDLSEAVTPLKGFDTLQGTDGDDIIEMPWDSDIPIMAVGGDGADTFVAQFPRQDDNDQPFDLLIPDFDETEDVLTLELISENMTPTAVAPQDFTLEPAKDGSFVDIRVSVYDTELGPDEAQEFVVRLDGISNVDPDSIFLADTDIAPPDESEPTEPDDIDPDDGDPEDTIVISGDVGNLDERGTRGDDVIRVVHDSGSVTVSGGAGEDIIDARDMVQDDDASLRIDGSEGDDTYLFGQGINVSDDQYGGADVYSMTVDPDQMHLRDPSTVVWDYEDRFEIVVPTDLMDSVRIENLPAREDPNLGAVVQLDEVYVGDTLVMRLINLDEEHRVTLDSAQFSVVAPSV